MQYSDFSVILGSLIKQCILLENFLQFSPHLMQNSGYTRPTLFMGLGWGVGLCELENAPEMLKCPKTFVHDRRCQTFKSQEWLIQNFALVYGCDWMPET